MQEFTPLDPTERELEQALGSLRLKTLAESEIWYQAGLKIGRRRSNIWRSIAAAVVLLAIPAVLWRPKAAPMTVERIVYVPAALPSAPIASAGGTTPTALSGAPYFQLRDAIERDGLKALPAGSGTGVLDQPVVHALSLSSESQISGDSL